MKPTTVVGIATAISIGFGALVWFLGADVAGDTERERAKHPNRSNESDGEDGELIDPLKPGKASPFVEKICLYELAYVSLLLLSFLT